MQCNISPKLTKSLLFSFAKKGSSKPWRAEQASETIRKESVIKSVVKETCENREGRTNHVDPRSVQLDLKRKDSREGSISNDKVKFQIERADERSSPILSRPRDVTTRSPQISHQSFVSSSLSGKGVDTPHYSNGTSGYSYLSRKAHDPLSSHRKVLDVERRGYIDTPKDDARVMMNKSKVNGLMGSPERVRDVRESKSKVADDTEDPSYLNYLKQNEKFYNSRNDKRLRYSEELINRYGRREEGMKRDMQRDNSERPHSPSSNVHETSEKLRSSFPVTTAHSVETIMNGRLRTSPPKPSERVKEDTREKNEWGARMSVRVPETVDPKRMEILSPNDMSRELRTLSRQDHEARGQHSRKVDERSRERDYVSRDREQRLRDQGAEKENVKIAEMERRRHEAAVSEHFNAAGRYFNPRAMHSGVLERSEIDSRLYAPNGDLRGFDPRNYDQRINEIVDVKSYKRNVGEKLDEKTLRSEERMSSRNETLNDRALSDRIPIFHNDEGRPQSAPHCGAQSVSRDADVKHTRTDAKSRESDTASHTGKNEAKTIESFNIGQSMPSKTRSPVNNGDVIVSKASTSIESSRTASVARPGNESSVRGGLGNLVMGPNGAGFPNVPMLNSDAYFQQLLLAQNESLHPMFIPMPNGVFPHPMSDPSHAPMNEYMMKAWREFLQGINVLSFF